MSDQTFISIVMPVLNEERHVEAALRSLISQVENRNAEILVMDGGSVDRTQAIVGDLAADFPFVKLFHNPARIQSAACNLASELMDARSTVLIRTDAHAAYPLNFVEDVLCALRASGATSVVVPMRTVGGKLLQRAIAAAQNSRLGNGGSRHRRAVPSQFVDHGHHAGFDAAFFRSIGGYDPSFTHNEDAEFDVRSHLAGGRVWLCAEATIDYFPRETLVALSRQYRRHGMGRARTVLKHRLPLRMRQLAPLVFLTSVVADILAPATPLLAAPSGLYLGASLLWGVASAVKQRDPALLLMGVASITMHLSWAVGFLDAQRQHVLQTDRGFWSGFSEKLSRLVQRQDVPEVEV